MDILPIVYQNGEKMSKRPSSTFVRLMSRIIDQAKSEDRPFRKWETYLHLLLICREWGVKVRLDPSVWKIRIVPRKLMQIKKCGAIFGPQRSHLVWNSGAFTVTSLDMEVLLHEMSHLLAATSFRRTLPEFGLGSLIGKRGTTDAAYADLVRDTIGWTTDDSDMEEAKVSILEVCLLNTLGQRPYCHKDERASSFYWYTLYRSRINIEDGLSSDRSLTNRLKIMDRAAQNLIDRGIINRDGVIPLVSNSKKLVLTKKTGNFKLCN